MPRQQPPKDPKNAQYQKNSNKNKIKKGLAPIYNVWVAKDDVPKFKKAHKKSRDAQERKYEKSL